MLALMIFTFRLTGESCRAIRTSKNFSLAPGHCASLIIAKEHSGFCNDSLCLTQILNLFYRVFCFSIKLHF